MNFRQGIEHHLYFGQGFFSTIFQDVVAPHVIAELVGVNVHLGPDVDYAWARLEFILTEAFLVFDLVQFLVVLGEVAVDDIGVVVNIRSAGDESGRCSQQYPA